MFIIQKPVLITFLNIIGVQDQLAFTFGTALVCNKL